MLIVLILTNSIEKKDIIKTWLAGQHSCTLVIPKDFAKQYGLDRPTHVVIEGKADEYQLSFAKPIEKEKKRKTFKANHNSTLK
jgi:hypothetical protein